MISAIGGIKSFKIPRALPTFDLRYTMASSNHALTTLTTPIARNKTNDYKPKCTESKNESILERLNAIESKLSDISTPRNARSLGCFEFLYTYTLYYNGCVCLSVSARLLRIKCEYSETCE